MGAECPIPQIRDLIMYSFFVAQTPPTPPPTSVDKNNPEFGTSDVSVGSRNCRCFDLTSNHDHGSQFSGQDRVSGHTLVIYQVKHLFDLDFTDQTHTRSDHRTRKELTRKSFVGLRPSPPYPHPVVILGMMRSRICGLGHSC